LDELRAALRAAAFHKLEAGRWFVAISLAEAETLRAIAHSESSNGEPLLGAGSRTAFALHVYEGHSRTLLDATAEYLPAHPTQALNAHTALRYVNSEHDFTHRELDSLLRMLQEAPPPRGGSGSAAAELSQEEVLEERRAWWDGVRRRRRRRALTDLRTLPIYTVFETASSYHRLARAALVARVRANIAKKGLTVADAFLVFDDDKDGVLSKQELYSAFTWLELHPKASEIHRIVRQMETANPEALTLAEWKAWLLTDDDDDDVDEEEDEQEEEDRREHGPLGLAWTEVADGPPPGGVELACPPLAGALQEGERAFDEPRLAALTSACAGEVRVETYVKVTEGVAERFFTVARARPAQPRASRADWPPIRIEQIEVKELKAAATDPHALTRKQRKALRARLVRPEGFTLKWDSRGAGDDQFASVWEPWSSAINKGDALPYGWLSPRKVRLFLGHIAWDRLTAPPRESVSMLEVEDTRSVLGASMFSGSGASLLDRAVATLFKQAVGYELLWSAPSHQPSIWAWRPRPPEGFVALGFLVTASKDVPPGGAWAGAVHCVPESWTVIDAGQPTAVWTDAGRSRLWTAAASLDAMPSMRLMVTAHARDGAPVAGRRLMKPEFALDEGYEAPPEPPEARLEDDEAEEFHDAKDEVGVPVSSSSTTEAVRGQGGDGRGGWLSSFLGGR